MSKNTPCVIFDWPHEDFIWWRMYTNWEMVESPWRYAACLSVIMLFSMQCFNNLSWIIDSHTFESVGKIEIGLKLIFEFFGPLLL